MEAKKYYILLGNFTKDIFTLPLEHVMYDIRGKLHTWLCDKHYDFDIIIVILQHLNSNISQHNYSGSKFSVKIEIICPNFHSYHYDPVGHYYDN